jgi:hypothetical protein
MPSYEDGLVDEQKRIIQIIEDFFFECEVEKHALIDEILEVR